MTTRTHPIPEEPTSVPEVVAALEQVLVATPASHPVQPFAAMYLRMTQAIAQALEMGVFQDPGFVARLDILFAERFLGPYAGRSSVPRCWEVLFSAPSRPGRELRYAVVGMNAHINLDLALAVGDTCRELGAEPGDDSPVHRDYLAVNTVIAETFDGAKRELLAGPLELADRALGEADDALGMWSIERARDAAWVRAQVLDQLGSLPVLREAYVATHDRAVALVGRALLALPDIAR